MDNEDAKDCGICAEEYNDADRCPRILPCFHTLCSSCILDVIRRNDKKCPFCRQGFAGNSATTFRINNNALDLVNYVKVLESRVSGRGAGLATIKAKSIKDLKKRVVEISLNNVAACEEAENKMINTIKRNNELKTNLVKANTNIQTYIIAKSQDIVTSNNEQIQLLEKKNRRLEADLFLMKKNEFRTKEFQQQMEEATTFTTAGPLIDMAEKVNSQIKNILTNVKESEEKDETMYQRIEKTITDIAERFSIIHDMLHTFQEESVDEETSPDLELAHMVHHESSQRSVTPESLASMDEQTRVLIQHRRIYAVQLAEGIKRFSRITISNKKYLCIHHLNETLPPANVQLLKYDDVIKMVDTTSRLSFIELATSGRPLGKLFIRLDHNNKISRNFQVMCLGTLGLSYANTKPIEVIDKGKDNERVRFGDYERGDGSGGKALVVGAGQEIGGLLKRPWRAGIIWSPHYGENKAAQFDIWLRDRSSEKLDASFGFVEDQLHILSEAISKYPNMSRDVVISDCGMVLKTL